MNKGRRSSIKQIYETLDQMRLHLEDIICDEEEAINNLQEHFPEHPMLEEMDEARDNLFEAMEDLVSALNKLEEVSS